MIVISAKELTKEYGTDIILDKISFHVNKGERVGIIGINGAGKTTLLKMLTGEIFCDGGDYFISSDLKVGYLKQDGEFNSDNTVIDEVESIFGAFPKRELEMEEVLAAIEKSQGAERDALLAKYDAMHEDFNRRGGYTYKSEITGVLSSMAFNEDSYRKKISTLSGGEKTRLALACLLLKKPDILFLDEPTNHLDIGTLKWLEQYLKNYRGTIILVSHDRYFLDQTVTRIFEIENHKLEIYEGSYSFYASERRKRREDRLRRYEKQQKEISRQEDMIRRFKERGTEKLAKRAASREKRLSAMEVVERPDALHGKMKISFKENFQSGKDVLLAQELSKSFGYGISGRRLFENVSMDIKRGERICIVGDNGIGKTTLLRILMGDIAPSSGKVKEGHNVQMGYYDQGQQLLNGDNTVIEELQDAYHLYSDTEMRKILGRFLFRGDTVFLRICSLSGGEKARLALLKLMLSGANVLVLDEPTNHLDIESKEVFEEALLDYPGTCIIVSHDRYFLNRIPTRIMELQASGIDNYLGAYNYYVEKKQHQIQSGKKYLEELAAKDSCKVEKDRDDAQMSSAERRKLQKEEEARARRLKRKKTELEEDISITEDEIKELEHLLTLDENMRDHVRLQEISDNIGEKKEILDKKYAEWMLLEE